MVSPLVAFFLFRYVAAMDSLTPSQSLKDGSSTTLVSQNGIFELGFFSPGISKNRYLGIWYKNIQVSTYVWVANRNEPINDTSGILVMNTTGHITLLSHNNTTNVVVWSARLLRKVSNPKLQILDTGNLVVKDETNSESFSWQSFDYPTDTSLPGMKLGWDLKNKIERNLTSWKNPNDPSTGDLAYSVEHLQFPELILWKNSKEYFRSGPWNGLRFSRDTVGNSIIGSLDVKFVGNEDEISYQYSVQEKSLTTRVKLDPYTNTISFYYRQAMSKGNWNLVGVAPADLCDSYAICGPNEYCDSSKSPVCSCLKGFKPITNSEGCEHNKPLKCSDEVGFAKFSQMKLPDTRRTWVNRSMNLEECRQICLRNCSCMAFAKTNISGSGSGCAIWIGDLIDLKFIPDAGQDLYVRVHASELEKEIPKTFSTKVKIVLIGTAIGFVLIVSVTSFYIFKKRSNYKANDGEKREPMDLELPMLELFLINNATNNFSLDNKLGEGGFGQVYKGKLANGQEIAVKRLSRNSGQGMNEFTNEVILIAKLQHRNLVKLLGCCIEGEERMLIYEYMPNKSLDFFIFDETRRRFLDWSKRYHIICGITRGIDYLHQDSSLRIIHRDLKASNVLLDADMNPKISDFGLAKTCFGDQTEGNTIRIAGTYGYMAPEYAFEGTFSTKSDVFSYGILLLEIISGKKCRGFHHGSNQNFIGYAWRLWKEGNPKELIDESIRESCNFSEVLRCIHISLLCIQQHPNNRPTMSSVIVMIGSEIPLPQPKQPSFFIEADEAINIVDSDSNKNISNSINDLTITIPNPR